jgi:hypothetical protein
MLVLQCAPFGQLQKYALYFSEFRGTDFPWILVNLQKTETVIEPKVSCVRKAAIALYPSQLKPHSTRPVLLSAIEIVSSGLCL